MVFECLWLWSWWCGRVWRYELMERPRSSLLLHLATLQVINKNLRFKFLSWISKKSRNLPKSYSKKESKHNSVFSWQANSQGEKGNTPKCSHFFSQVTSKKKNFYQECNIIDDTDLKRGSDLQFSKCGAPSYDQFFLLSFAHLFLSGKVRSRRLSAKAALYDPSTSTPHPHPQHI